MDDSDASSLKAASPTQPAATYDNDGSTASEGPGFSMARAPQLVRHYTRSDPLRGKVSIRTQSTTSAAVARDGPISRAVFFCR